MRRFLNPTGDTEMNATATLFPGPIMILVEKAGTSRTREIGRIQNPHAPPTR